MEVMMTSDEDNLREVNNNNMLRQHAAADQKRQARANIDKNSISAEMDISAEAKNMGRKELKIYNKNNNFKISLPKNNFDVSLLINKAGKC